MQISFVLWVKGKEKKGGTAMKKLIFYAVLIVAAFAFREQLFNLNNQLMSVVHTDIIQPVKEIVEHFNDVLSLTFI